MKSMLMGLGLAALMMGCAAEQVGSPGALAAPPPSTTSADVAIGQDGALPAWGGSSAAPEISGTGALAAPGHTEGVAGSSSPRAGR